MYGVEERLEWLNEVLESGWTVSQLMQHNLIDWDELFGKDNFDDFKEYFDENFKG